jgi:hypothetical protein
VNGIAGIGPRPADTPPAPEITHPDITIAVAVAPPVFVTVSRTWNVPAGLHTEVGTRLTAASNAAGVWIRTVFDNCGPSEIVNPVATSVAVTVVVNRTSPGDAPV